MDHVRERLHFRRGPREPAWELMRPHELEDTMQIGMSALGATIRRTREAVGLSQRELARLVGMNQSTISRLETGQLRRLRFQRLAMVFGVLHDPLLGPSATAQPLVLMRPGRIARLLVARAVTAPRTTSWRAMRRRRIGRTRDDRREEALA